MVPVHRLSLSLHRRFGHFATLIFACHICASLNNIVFDEAKHVPISKILLMTPVVQGTVCMVHAIERVIHHDNDGHKDYAFLAFLFSIEGAGTIRTVAHVQSMFAKFLYLPEHFGGPHICQAQFQGKATECVFGYCIPLVLTRVLTLYFISVYM